MTETGNLTQGQNTVEVRYVTAQGAQLLQPVRLTQLIGEQYQISPPIIEGFVLVNRPEDLIQTMTAMTAEIDLIYAKLGSLHVYHSLADITGELIPLRNGQTADSVAPVQLQPIPAHSYYILTDDGLGEPVLDASHFQPNRVDGTTKLISLTEEERRQMTDLEKSLTLDVAEALAGQPIPQQPKPKPLPESTQPAQPQPSATYPVQPQSVIDTVDLPESQTSQVVNQIASSTRQNKMNMGQEGLAHVELNKPPEQTLNTQSTEAASDTKEQLIRAPGSAVGALAKSVVVISRGLGQSPPHDKQSITELTACALRLIQAIKRLN